MKNKAFLQAVKRLKRDTGTAIDQIGMKVETKNFRLDIYGNLEDNYEMVVDDAEQRVFLKWKKIDFTDEQINILTVLFNKEVEKAEKEHKLSQEIEYQEEQREDVIYNNNY